MKSQRYDIVTTFEYAVPDTRYSIVSGFTGTLKISILKFDNPDECTLYKVHPHFNQIRDGNLVMVGSGEDTSYVPYTFIDGLAKYVTMNGIYNQFEVTYRIIEELKGLAEYNKKNKSSDNRMSDHLVFGGIKYFEGDRVLVKTNYDLEISGELSSIFSNFIYLEETDSVINISNILSIVKI